MSSFIGLPPSTTIIRFVILLLVVVCSAGCTGDESYPWKVSRADRSAVGDDLQETFEMIRDSVRARIQVRDSLWRISERRQPAARVNVQWSGRSPTIEQQTVRGDTLYWIHLDPYLINPADTSVRLGHYRHLPLPVCRAYYRGGWLKSYDYESVQSIRTSSTLPPGQPFDYRYGGCSIPIQGPGYYVVIAEARLFQRLSPAERALIDSAYTEMSEPEAIRLQRQLQRTVPLFIASEPVILQVE